MACAISCMISAIFLIGMIYFYYITDKTNIVQTYKKTLSKEKLYKFNEISKERMKITREGYIIGVVLSLLIIFYNNNFTQNKIKNESMVCIVIAIAFITNYFYYTLYPKSDTMLNYIQNNKDAHNWAAMYKGMQYNYHSGMVFGIIAVGFMAFAFRC